MLQHLEKSRALGMTGKMHRLGGKLFIRQRMREPQALKGRLIDAEFFSKVDECSASSQKFLELIGEVPA